MNVHAALLDALDRLASSLAGARFERRDGYCFISFPSFPLPFLNGMWADTDAAAEHIDDARADAERLGTPFTVMVREGRSPAVEAAAMERGFAAALRLPGMGVSRTAFRDTHVADLEITRVETARHLEDAAAMIAPAFGMPPDWAAAVYVPEVVALDGLQYYLGRVDGRPVATAMGFTIGAAVGIFNVATPEEDRGRGYGGAVTARAVRDGFERGATFGALQSSALGESVYRRLGFEQVETYAAFTEVLDGS